MSLIHQVLQDLDGHREAQDGAVVGYAEDDDNHGLRIWPAVLVSLLAAGLVFHFSEYLKGSVTVVDSSALPVLPTEPVDYLSQSADVAVEVPQAPVAPMDVLLAEQVEILLDVAPDPAEVSLLSTPVTSQSDRKGDALPVMTQPPVTRVSTNSRSVSQASSAASTSSSATTGVSKGASTVASVTRSRSAQTIYQRAVADYQAGDWRSALVRLTAMNEGKGPSHLALQARIYLEQSMRREFMQLHRQHAATRAGVWLSTVAPGLHVFGEFAAAAEEYARLMVLEPNNSQWGLARIQAHIDAGQMTQARNQLTLVNDRYTLTPDQQVWVNYQLDILE